MMRVGRVAFTIAASILVLRGCVPPHQTVVVNNTGAPIILKAEDIYWFWGGDAIIAPRGHATRMLEDMLPPGLLIETVHCAVGYDLPPLTPTYRFRTGTDEPTRILQVEPDLTVTLLDRAGPTANAELGREQRKYGFPIRPLFKKCQADRLFDYP